VIKGEHVLGPVNHRVLVNEHSDRLTSSVVVHIPSFQKVVGDHHFC
jgi:hypothetical protein